MKGERERARERKKQQKERKERERERRTKRKKADKVREREINTERERERDSEFQHLFHRRLRLGFGASRLWRREVDPQVAAQVHSGHIFINTCEPVSILDMALLSFV